MIMKITVESSGNFNFLERFLERAKLGKYWKILDGYGEQGVKELARMTPKDSGLTADSWSYDITREKDGWTINWSNSNTNEGENIALLIQYGHGQRQGGYVTGIDYINPALSKVFKNLADSCWKEMIGS